MDSEGLIDLNKKGLYLNFCGSNFMIDGASGSVGIITSILSLINDKEIGIYGSQGQHRTAILSLKLAELYVTIIRGTPAVLQLMIIYYIIFRTVDINPVLVGIIAFGINSGAYVSEIIRSGINSIDKGQKEAASSLGLTYRETMKSIILPQAIRNVLPALGNEFITLLKETSVAGYIGIVDLVKAADIIASGTYNYFFPLIIIAIIYLILTIGLSKLLTVFEKKVLDHARG